MHSNVLMKHVKRSVLVISITALTLFTSCKRIQEMRGAAPLPEFPNDSIEKIEFESVGGMIFPEAIRKFSLTYDGKNQEMIVTLEGHIWRAIPGCVPIGSEECYEKQELSCNWRLDKAETDQFTTNLRESFLAEDKSGIQIIDAGDLHLRFVYGSREILDYRFSGGDTSHQGAVIFGESLKSQFWNVIYKDGCP